MSRNSKGTEATLAEKLSEGTQKHLANTTQLVFAGGTFTPAQVETQLQSLVTMRDDVDAARAALTAKVAIETAKAPAVRAFMVDFEAFVRVTFGNQADVLADFGLSPKKVRTPLSGEQQAAANAKSKATRAARGTVGKTKKLAITGNVTGVLVTPITNAHPTPVATAPSASPITGAH